MIIIRAQRITKMQMLAITRSAHIASSNPTRKFCNCIFCSRTIEKPHERYLVSGKTKFNAIEAPRQSPFDVLETSLYICRQCLDKRRKRATLLAQEKLIVSELKQKYEKYARNASIAQHIIPLNKVSVRG